MAKGLKRDHCLTILNITKSEFYYSSTGTKSGKSPSFWTNYRDPKTMKMKLVSNEDVVKRIIELKLDQDHPNWYRLITRALQIEGYFINHKKVLRLMREYVLLEEKRSPAQKEYARYRCVTPSGPLKVIEMDIKYVWVTGEGKYAYILSILDTFTRYCLNWSVGYRMQSIQVKEAWEYVIANYFQPSGCLDTTLDVEIRSDNGKQFGSELIMKFFKDNYLHKVFTHPYTPEENGHIESFNKTLGTSLSRDSFNNLEELTQRLNRLYRSYNNCRSHGSTLGIPPSKFWALYEQGKIDVLRPRPQKQVFKLTIPYQDILLLTGIDKYDFVR